MICAARLAVSLDRVDGSFVQRLQGLLENLDLPVQTPALNHDDLLAAMQRDKKAEQGQLRFVLPTRLGHVELVGGVPADLAKRALTA